MTKSTNKKPSKINLATLTNSALLALPVLTAILAHSGGGGTRRGRRR